MLLDTQTKFETIDSKEWAREVSATFGGLELSVDDSRKFKGALNICKISDFNLVMAQSTPAKIWHRGSIGKFSENERFLVKTQFSGTSQISFGSETVSLSPGDFVICDNAKSYCLSFEEETSILSIPIPLKVLGRFHSKPSDLAFKSADMSNAANKIVSDYIRSLWASKSMEAHKSHSERLLNHFFDLLVMGYEVNDEIDVTISSTQSGHLERCKAFIDENLMNETLTPALLAEEFNISKRYLFSVFASANLTVSSYIISQRLDRGAQMLRSRRFERLTISEIAFDVGFKSSAHFSRAFRAAFSESPSQYRKRIYA